MVSQILATEEKLRQLGVLPGMRVAFHVPNSTALAVAIVACWRLGAVVVPLSMRYTKTQVSEAVEGMACDVLIQPETLERLCFYKGHVFDRVCLSDLALDLSRDATIVLTSGSTGQPKGVLHTVANHVASARASEEVLPFVEGDVWGVSLPLYHVGGLALIVRALLHGGGLLFVDKDWRTALIEKKVTHLSVVPTQLRQLLARPDTADALRLLKGVLVGGAPCPEGLVHQARALGIPIHITYGASEAGSQITTTRDDPVGSGRALSHAEVCIGKDGEILVKSQSLCRGYVFQDAVTPLVDEAGWFHTGDLGALDEKGHLFVLGRKDTQFISGGENIHPEEIERAILALPAVEQCVVVPVPDATYGRRPVAFIKGAPGRQALAGALSGLERFKHPDHILDWPTEHFGQMKPDRPALQQLAESLVK